MKMVLNNNIRFDRGYARKIIKRLQQYSLVHLNMIVVLLISGFIINIIQLILFGTIRFVNKRWYRKINYYLMYSFQSQMVLLPTWWTESTVHLYMDKDDYKTCGKEHALLLGNHSYELDWFMGLCLADTVGVLGNCKAFIKKSIQYVPVVGWAWKFGEYIFLDRSFEKDKKNISMQIRELGDFPDPVWLGLFVEGTRLTPAKLKVSQEFAIKRNLPVLKHHLLPRTKGFVASLEGMRDKQFVIYDYQIAYHKNALVKPTVINAILGKPVEAHLFIKRILLDELPKHEEGLKKWLYEHFEKKDKLQESFFNTGNFFKESGIPPIEPFIVQRKITLLVNSICWNMIIMIPLLSYSILWILNGGITNAAIAFVVILLLNYMSKKMFGLLQINKSSKYGVEK